MKSVHVPAAALSFVAPAKAGAHIPEAGVFGTMGPRFRGDHNLSLSDLPRQPHEQRAVFLFHVDHAQLAAGAVDGLAVAQAKT
jgi:hypothetical protein